MNPTDFLALRNRFVTVFQRIRGEYIAQNWTHHPPPFLALRNEVVDFVLVFNDVYDSNATNNWRLVHHDIFAQQVGRDELMKATVYNEAFAYFYQWFVWLFGKHNVVTPPLQCCPKSSRWYVQQSLRNIRLRVIVKQLYARLDNANRIIPQHDVAAFVQEKIQQYAETDAPTTVIGYSTADCRNEFKELAAGMFDGAGKRCMYNMASTHRLDWHRVDDLGVEFFMFFIDFVQRFGTEDERNMTDVSRCD